MKDKQIEVAGTIDSEEDFQKAIAKVKPKLLFQLSDSIKIVIDPHFLSKCIQIIYYQGLTRSIVFLSDKSEIKRLLNALKEGHLISDFPFSQNMRLQIITDSDSSSDEKNINVWIDDNINAIISESTEISNFIAALERLIWSYS